MYTRSIIPLTIALAIPLISGCATRYAFVPDDYPPSFYQGYKTVQHSVGVPPFARPPGKREAIRISSQKFTIVIPDCIDVSQRSDDVRRSLADMMYTALFETGRFNLFDRGELVDIDPNQLIRELSRRERDRDDESESDRRPTSAPDLLEQRQRVQATIARGIAREADGLLLMYITGRKGTDAGGTFDIDYRIVSAEHGRQSAVLLARSESVRYNISSQHELVYNREDIQNIAQQITEIFPRQQDIPERSRVVSIDSGFITIDIGTDNALKPGLRGYVFAEEDLADLPGVKQKVFLAQFQITEVYQDHSRARILPGINRQNEIILPGDIMVGDRVLIQ